MAPRAKSPKKDYYKEIADKLIKNLEEGTAPWQKPWQEGGGQMPHNPVSGTRYKGGNYISLLNEEREDPRWMTFKQAKSEEWSVKKGEKRTRIIYFKWEEEKAARDANGAIRKDGEGKTIKEKVKIYPPRMFSSVVFNGEQIKGIDKYVVPPRQRG